MIGNDAKHLLATALLATGATGCATGEDIKPADLIGASREAVSRSYGEPTRADRASDGRELWVYYKTRRRSLRSGLQIAAPAPGGDSAGRSERTMADICITTFRFDADGRVAAAQQSEDGC